MQRCSARQPWVPAVAAQQLLRFQAPQLHSHVEGSVNIKSRLSWTGCSRSASSEMSKLIKGLGRGTVRACLTMRMCQKFAAEGGSVWSQICPVQAGKG